MNRQTDLQSAFYICKNFVSVAVRYNNKNQKPSSKETSNSQHVGILWKYF